MPNDADTRPRRADHEGKLPDGASLLDHISPVNINETGAPPSRDAKVSGLEESSQSSPENTGAAAHGEVLEPSGAAEVVRQMTIKVLSERIRLLGTDRSGAYEHYNLQLVRGFPIPPGEIAILDLVRRRLPNLRSYHEIGSGLGTLPLMLAHDGFAAVGVERDERRHLTATTILRELSAQLPHIESNCRLFGASFPGAVADLDVSDSIAILTDFVSTQAPHDYIKLCQGLAEYRYVLLDLQRFCLQRMTKEKQEQLIEELAAYGLSPCPETIDLDSQGYFRLFESKPLEKHPEMTENSKTSEARNVAVERKELTPASSELRQQVPTVGRTEVTPAPSGELQVPTSDVQTSPGRFVLRPMPQRVRRKRFGGLLGLSALLVIGIPTLLAVAYYGFWASNQYVTSFQFAVRGPSQAAAGKTSGPAALGGIGAMSPDAFVATDYINSPQAISDVERDVDLRAIFSKPDIDFWSRLAPNVTPEELSAYWTKMVWAHFDLISGNVSVSVRAFTPRDSLKLAQALTATSNEMFRQLNSQAQHDFVQHADENLGRARQQLATARQELLAFREKSGLVEPDKTAQAGSSIIDDLRKQLAGLQAQVASIRATSPNSPSLATLNSQIAALEGQIRNLGQLGSSSVKAVTAEILGQYQTLDLEHKFAEKQYTDALDLRSQAYLMAQSQQSYLALFVEPTLAQTSLYPDRPRAIVSIVLAAAAAWFIGMLLTYAVRDHLI